MRAAAAGGAFPSHIFWLYFEDCRRWGFSDLILHFRPRKSYRGSSSCMFPYVYMSLRVYVPSCVMYVPPCVCPYCIYVPSVCMSPPCVYPFKFPSVCMSLRLCVSLCVCPLRVSLWIKSVALSGLSLWRRGHFEKFWLAGRSGNF